MLIDSKFLRHSRSVDLEFEYDPVLHDSELPHDSITPSQIQALAPPPASQPDNSFYAIEKVLKRRIRKGTEECFVSGKVFLPNIIVEYQHCIL